MDLNHYQKKLFRKNRTYHTCLNLQQHKYNPLYRKLVVPYGNFEWVLFFLVWGGMLKLRLLDLWEKKGKKITNQLIYIFINKIYLHWIEYLICSSFLTRSVIYKGDNSGNRTKDNSSGRWSFLLSISCFTHLIQASKTCSSLKLIQFYPVN